MTNLLLNTGHKNDLSTASEENYIKAIFKLEQELEGEVPTSTLAEYLATKASSVTDMIQKLAYKKLVNYKKYHGVTLNPLGEKIAVKMLRKHRLWELFLYQILGFKWDEIHDIAEELEHVKSDVLIERLDKFLDFPQKDPHGDPIPDENGIFPEDESLLLSKLNKGFKGFVAGVKDKSSSLLIYLDKKGIRLGTEIEIIEINEFDNSFDLKINNLSFVHLSFKVVQNILMIKK
jgi:DtxR family transcriptional regulator, Mn-dependent transcriptional regulator